MKQQRLLHGEHLPPRLRYQQLFAYLPVIPTPPGCGRPRTDPNVLLRALVYRCLRGLSSLSDLVYSLAENPSLAEAVGLDPFRPLPTIERFSAWLRSTPNESLQQIRMALVRRLIEQGAVPGVILALDGSAVPSPVRENNLKTCVSDRFNKHYYPKADPQARLGVYRAYIGSKKISYFWGYRNHIVVDFATELPLCEQTHPANQQESRFAIPLLETCHRQFDLPIKVVCADSGYDNEKLLSYVIEQLKAQPIIAPNARYQPNPDFQVKSKLVLCPAQLPMVFKGHMTPKKTGITYKQYCCPLHYRKRMRQRFLLCPVAHPKFLAQKGCNYLLRLTASYRSQIDYGSSHFTALYKKRSSAERVFARLLSLTMHKPTVRGLLATQNHCTIAHITVLLVAAAAQDLGRHDKLAFVRSFVPKFLS